jgi:hypothetical protein
MKHLTLFENFHNYLQLCEIEKISAPNDIVDVAEWMGKPVDMLSFRFKYEPISKFIDVINELENSYPDFPSEKARTKKIYKSINNGSPLYAIFVDEKDNFILEGRHRVVAFKWLGVDTIPVIYVK